MPKSTRNVFELVAVAENHSDFSFVKAIMTDEGAVGGVGSVGVFIRRLVRSIFIQRQQICLILSMSLICSSGVTWF